VNKYNSVSEYLSMTWLVCLFEMNLAHRKVAIWEIHTVTHISSKNAQSSEALHTLIDAI
jgi:hypothetical protein